MYMSVNKSTAILSRNVCSSIISTWSCDCRRGRLNTGLFTLSQWKRSLSCDIWANLSLLGPLLVLRCMATSDSSCNVTNSCYCVSHVDNNLLNVQSWCGLFRSISSPTLRSNVLTPYANKLWSTA